MTAILKLFRPESETADWTDGAPAHVTAETLVIDRRVCRSLRCRCGKRGLGFRPQHAPNGRYRVLAACPCGWVEML